MAANPVARFCACGCGQSLDGMRRDALRTRACQKLHERAQSRTPEAAERRRQNQAKVQNQGRKRACAHDNPGHYVHTDPVYIPTKRCQYCANIPDARTIDRVINDNALVITFVARVPPGYSDRPNLPCCVGCGERYGADTPIARGSYLRSSASTCAKAGELWGYKVNQSDKDLHAHNGGRKKDMK